MVAPSENCTWHYTVKPKKILTFGSMEISANLVCVCLLDLILLSTLITKSVGSQDVVRAERDTVFPTAG